MARKSLRPYMNQIRAWTRQGRTDAWVAHQLEVSVQDVEEFKRQSGLAEVETEGAPDGDEEIDLRAADEALIAAELEAAQIASAQAEEEEQAAEAGPAGSRPRRRSRRGGSGRRGGARPGGPMEGTFDHGEEGYGLWLDPAIRDDPVYAEYWAGHRPVEVSVEEDQIVIRRAGETDARAGAEEVDAADAA